MHPFLQQREAQDFGREQGTLTQAWSPIGAITTFRDGEHGSAVQHPAVGATAEAHGKSPAHVMLC